jgi:hypothetical protein
VITENYNLIKKWEPLLTYTSDKCLPLKTNKWAHAAALFDVVESRYSKTLREPTLMSYRDYDITFIIPLIRANIDIFLTYSIEYIQEYIENIDNRCLKSELHSYGVQSYDIFKMYYKVNNEYKLMTLDEFLIANFNHEDKKEVYNLLCV